MKSKHEHPEDRKPWCHVYIAFSKASTAGNYYKIHIIVHYGLDPFVNKYLLSPFYMQGSSNTMVKNHRSTLGEEISINQIYHIKVEYTIMTKTGFSEKIQHEIPM